MKITLINPPYSLQERYGEKIPKDLQYTLPPLGLMYIASSLEKYNHKVSIIDIPAYNYTTQEIIEKIKQENPKIIGITALTPTINNTLKLSREIKQNFPNILIVLGGAHPSGFPQKILEENKFVDIIVIGEGELTFPELCDKIEKKKPLSTVKGIAYNYKDKIIINPKREYVKNLDEIPFPARHLVPLKTKYKQLPYHYKKQPLVHMITSRGCPYGKCTFCFEAGRLGPYYRKRSPENVVEEIKQIINDYGAKEISFWDDNFVVGEKWVKKFNELLKKENIKISWSCSSRIDMLNEEILKEMKNAGCWTIFIGVESGDQDLLNRIKKGTNLEQIKQVVRMIQKLGIEIRASFMLALPGETPEKAEKTIKFAIELDPDYAQFCTTSPYDGTELYQDALASGSLLKNLDYYNSMTPAFVPEGYSSLDEVKKMQEKAFRKFYMRPKFIYKKLRSIKSIEDIKRYYEGFKFYIGFTR